MSLLITNYPLLFKNALGMMVQENNDHKYYITILDQKSNLLFY